VSAITRLSLHLGVVVLLGVVLLFGAGIFAATQVQQDLLPDISIPAIIVITPDPGASPEIVDTRSRFPRSTPSVSRLIPAEGYLVTAYEPARE
jgi:Cu/Ag efflux pump CusA